MKKIYLAASLIVVFCLIGSGIVQAAHPKVDQQSELASEKVYSNKVFRDVNIKKIAPNQYVVKGEASVFEGTVNYVLSNGQTDLNKAFVTASQGGPGWGTFEIQLDTSTLTPNEKLNVILFEINQETGQRVNELVVPLPSV